jgi:hypothetical protein
MPERVSRRFREKRRVMVRFGAVTPERTGFTMNLSLDGAFLRTNDVLAPGSRLVLEVPLGDRVWTLHGRVAWAKRAPTQLAHLVTCGMGIRFVDPDPEWEAAYSEWLAPSVRRPASGNR